MEYITIITQWNVSNKVHQFQTLYKLLKLGNGPTGLYLTSVKYILVVLSLGALPNSI